MKIFTPQQLKTQEEKKIDQLRSTKEYLEKEIKHLTARVETERSKYDLERKAVDKDFRDFCDTCHDKKSLLLRELSEVEETLEKKKDLIQSLTEKEDELQEREHQIIIKEKNLADRERYIQAVEHKIVLNSHV